MAEIYFRLVLAKKRTCNSETKDILQVPENIKEEVLTLLGERGYDKDGNKI